MRARTTAGSGLTNRASLARCTRPTRSSPWPRSTPASIPGSAASIPPGAAAAPPVMAAAVAAFPAPAAHQASSAADTQRWRTHSSGARRWTCPHCLNAWPDRRVPPSALYGPDLGGAEGVEPAGPAADGVARVRRGSEENVWRRWRYVLDQAGTCTLPYFLDGGRRRMLVRELSGNRQHMSIGHHKPEPNL